MVKLKKIPAFKNEDEEAKFWLRVDATKYLDFSRAEHWVFPNLKLTSRPITMRLPGGLINEYKQKANKMDVPYQSLMKQVLFKGLASI
ncbi:BrnA antitoxin family protein [Candidatus Gottesmanbacteria bacterium]|nr:BrnA antitoxin family protein [Candidatus Gottesmanbacteria bacterium]